MCGDRCIVAAFKFRLFQSALVIMTITCIIVILVACFFIFPHKYEHRFLDFRVVEFQTRSVILECRMSGSWGECCGFGYQVDKSELSIYPYVRLFPFHEKQILKIDICPDTLSTIKVVDPDGNEEVIYCGEAGA